MNWPKLIKADGTPSGEWISLVITALPYPILIVGLFLKWIPLDRLIEIGGLVTIYSVVIWGGYMGKKTLVEFGKIKIQMNGDKDDSEESDMDNRGDDSPADSPRPVDSVNYPVGKVGQGKGRGK